MPNGVLRLAANPEVNQAKGKTETARACTRARKAGKSVLASGVVGWLAAASNQASSSGVKSKGLRCGSRRERMTSLISSLASVQTPARTYSGRNPSASRSRATVMK